jgi:hypothetical protein
VHDARVVAGLMARDLTLLLEHRESKVGPLEQQAPRCRKADDASSDDDHVISVNHPTIVAVYRAPR